MPRVRRCRQQGCHAMCQYPNRYCTNHQEQEAEYNAKRNAWHERSQRQVHRYNTTTRQRDDVKQNQYAFYRTRAWSQLRIRVLERDNYVCQYCLEQNHINPAKTVDHIVPIEFNNTLKENVDNLAVICRKCHYRKTEWEQKYYGTGQGNNLKNVPEIFDLKKIILLW